MAKNRLIKSSKGNGYGILDEETNMVTPVSFDTNKLIESKKGNGFGLQFGNSVVPVDISGLGKSDISLFKKKVDTELSGETSSTDGEDSAWSSPLRFLSGVGKAVYGKAIDFLEGSMRAVAASGMGASTTAPTITMREAPKEGDVQRNIQAFEQTAGKFLESAKPTVKGSADVFTAKGVRIPDAEAAGYQIGDGLAQLGLNVFGGGAGLAVNYFANTEKNYQEARKQGISEDKALLDSGIRAGAETLLDKFLGAEMAIGKFAGKQAAKVGTEEALKQLAEKGLGKEAFDEMVSRGIKLFSKEGLETIGKGVGFEALDEFGQTYADEGIKTLFNNYQLAKKEENPNAKIELYDADLGSSKTFYGALNAAFYGGLSGGMGARFTGSRAFSPTVYSSLQNAYDAGGTAQLQESAAQVEKGINDALASNKMTPQQHEQALFNLNNIATDVQSYSQNSTADSFTRFSKFEIENSHIPNAVQRVSDTFVDRLSPVLQANESDIKNDIEQGNFVEMQFDSRENAPIQFLPYVAEQPTQLEGQEVFEAKIPVSVAQAQEQNTQNKSSVLQAITNAITDITNTSNFISFDKLIDRIKMTLPDEKSREAFGLEAAVAKESVSKDLRLINLLNESKREINKSATFDSDAYNNKLKNWLTANQDMEVEYKGNKHKIEDVSYDGQQVKLSGIAGDVNTSEITPFIAEEAQPIQEANTEIETIRAQEQAELMEAIPNAENYVTDGKVDRTKITDPNDLKTFDEIYDKYDKIVTPLLATTEVSSTTPTEEIVSETLPEGTQQTLEQTPVQQDETATEEESTTENVGEENNPSQPPIPPVPPTDEQMSEEEENKPLSDQENDLTVLSREESKKKAEELKKEQKTTWESLVEAFVNSDVKIKNILTRAAGKKSFVVSLLRNRRGLTASINQTINKANEKIFKGLNEIGMSRFNSLGYALRTIQLDQKRLAKQQKEIERLTKEFNDKNDKLPENKRKAYNEKVRAEIESKAKAKFPILNHGTVKIKVNGIEKQVPMTSQIAQETIDSIKAALGENAYNKMSNRIDEYKSFGNMALKESYDAGMISKEVYDDLKDDFYSLRATVERTFEQFSPSDRVMYQSAVDKAFGSLSKDGTTKVMITDTPLLMQTSYNIMKRAIKKNELKKAMFDATVAQGKESEYFRAAQVETFKDENGNEVVRQNEKGDVVVKNTPKGFTLVGYKQDGRAKYFFMEESLNNKMYNLNNTFDSDAIQSKFIMNMINAENFGNRVLTGFATRYNPLFFISNTQMDMAQQVIFTDIWDGGKNYSNLASSTMRALVRSAKFIDIRGRNTEMIEKTLERATELGLMMDMLSTSSETRKMYKETGEIGPMEQMEPDNKLKKAAKMLTKLNLKTEVAMRLAAFTEVQSNLTNDFEKENGRKPNEREQYEIDTIAVAQARAYTDFAEKGTYTPKLNMPYLTSSISAFSSAMEYVADNPRQFAWKASQIAASGFVGQLAAMSIMGLVGEPEDWENVKDYDKDRNILIPFAFKTVKDKFGKDKIQWSFVPIRVNPTIAPIWIASRKAAEATYYSLHDIKNKETSGLDKLDSFIEAINVALPAAIPIGTSLEKIKQRAGLTISRKLWMAAAFKTITGYDPYRGQDLLTYEDKQGESGAEGLENKNVPYVYKAIGKSGLSPVRTQAFVETFTTGNHMLVQTAYALTSDVAAVLMQEKSPTIRGEKSLTNIPMMLKGLTGNRISVSSDVNHSYNKDLQSKYKESNEVSRKYLTQERELQIKLQDLKDASKDDKDFLNKVRTEVLPEYQDNKDIVGQLDVMQTATKIATKSIKKGAITPESYDEAAIIKVTQTPKGQAEMLYYMFGDDKAKVNATINKAAVLGVSTTDAGLMKIEYEKLLKQK